MPDNSASIDGVGDNARAGSDPYAALDASAATTLSERWSVRNSALAVVVLTAIAWPALRLAWPAIRQRLFGLIVAGAVGVGLFSYFLLGGAYQSLALEVGFINATTPVWVLLIGLGLGRKPQMRRVSAS